MLQAKIVINNILVFEAQVNKVYLQTEYQGIMEIQTGYSDCILQIKDQIKCVLNDGNFKIFEIQKAIAYIHNNILEIIETKNF